MRRAARDSEVDMKKVRKNLCDMLGSEVEVATVESSVHEAFRSSMDKIVVHRRELETRSVGILSARNRSDVVLDPD